MVLFALATPSVAQDAIRIFFPSGDATLRREYMTNAESFAELDSLLSIRGEMFVDSVLVVSKASPDGSSALNLSLSQRRAEAMRRYVSSAHPELRSRVRLRGMGETWDDLRAAVVADSKLSEESRRRILGVLDAGIRADVKKTRLRALPEYRYIVDELFPELRVSQIVVIFDKAVYEMQARDLFSFELDLEEPDLSVPVEKIEMKEDLLEQITVLPLPMPRAGRKTSVTEEGAVRDERDVRFALKTNLLYDLAITPNFSLEIPAGRRFSFGFNYEFPWWVSRDNSRAWEILHLEPFLRLWLGNRSKRSVLTGFYAGVAGGVGYYDIEPFHKGWQGEAVNAGLEIGYAWAFGRNKYWRFETGVGAGWMKTWYSSYEGTPDDRHLIWQRDGRYEWLGPVKVNASISYLFHRKKKEVAR